MSIFSSLSSNITASKSGSKYLNGRNISVSSLQAFGKVLITYPESAPTLGGSLFVNGSDAGIFGYTIKRGNQTINSSYSVSDWFNNDNDSSQCISVFGDLTIDSGYTLQPSTRKLFTLLYVQGNLTLNGTISMTARDANHGSTGNHGLVTPINLILDSVGRYIPATDGASNSGAASNGGTGGGGSGGSSEGGGAGNGAVGTCFSGGPGGGGAYGSGAAAGSGTAYGGPGGYAANAPGQAKYIGGGAGNPGGAGAQGGAAGGTGTGGTLVIFVTGQISGSGTIESKGSNGGNTNGEERFDPGGGGSGGGSINLFYGSTSGTYTKSASGGSGGSNGQSPFFGQGGAGGAGSIRTFTL
jgi:hypothetical protein